MPVLQIRAANSPLFDLPFGGFCQGRKVAVPLVVSGVPEAWREKLYIGKEIEELGNELYAANRR